MNEYTVGTMNTGWKKTTIDYCNVWLKTDEIKSSPLRYGESPFGNSHYVGISCGVYDVIKII